MTSSKKEWLAENELETFDPSIHLDYSLLSRNVEIAVRYIHEHLFDPQLNVQRVKDQCALKNHNVSSRFKQQMGKGMRQYIEAQRIEAAAHLLRHESLKIYWIAFRVGYTYVESFERAFKRQKRCSPSAFREVLRGTTSPSSFQ